MASDGLWILVMNASRARILRSVEPTTASGTRDLLLRAAERRLREMLVRLDAAPPRPGRRAVGRSGAGVEPWRSLLEADRDCFSREVAGFLEAHRLAGDFGRLVVFARPGVLGRLHTAMPNHLRTRVMLEVEQDIIDLPSLALHSRIAETLKSL